MSPAPEGSTSPTAPAEASPSPEATAEASPSPTEPTATTEPSPSPEARSAATLPVLCRDAWDAAAPRPGGRGHTIRQITVHHSAAVLGDNRRAPDRLRQHQRYHQDTQGWIDIAYHYGVDRHGNVYELRDTALAGDTGTDYDPAGHLLLLAEGNFDEEQPTDAQLWTLADLAAAGIERHGLGGDLATVVSGHRDHASTSCPGAALYARLDELRAAVRDALDAGGVDLRAWCGSGADAHVADIRAGRDAPRGRAHG